MIELGAIQQLRGQEEGEGEGFLECLCGPKFEKKSSYNKKYFIPLCTGNRIFLHFTLLGSGSEWLKDQA